MNQIDDRLIHLTNDAVQKQAHDYGKFESGNKLSYQEFDRILAKERGISFLQKVVPRIKQAVKDMFEATGQFLYKPSKFIREQAPHFQAYNGFEVLGLDFMLDNELNLRFIEVNTNPCLETPCLLLQRLIP